LVDEANHILAAAMPYSRPLLLFLMMTGARFGEAMKLDWKRVNLQQHWAVLEDTKRKGENRGVPLHPQVVAMLANLPGKHDKGPVFLRQDGKAFAVIDEDANKRPSIKTAWRSTLRRAGITDPMRIHDLRHTFSTWFTLTHASIRIRDEIMGHATNEMGSRYAHVPRDEAIVAVNKLPSLGFPVSPALVEELSRGWSNQARKQILNANEIGIGHNGGPPLDDEDGVAENG